jgi:hypothetical protein
MKNEVLVSFGFVNKYENRKSEEATRHYFQSFPMIAKGPTIASAKLDKRNNSDAVVSGDRLEYRLIEGRLAFRREVILQVGREIERSERLSPLMPNLSETATISRVCVEASTWPRICDRV